MDKIGSFLLTYVPWAIGIIAFVWGSVGKIVKAIEKKTTNSLAFKDLKDDFREALKEKAHIRIDLDELERE